MFSILRISLSSKRSTRRSDVAVRDWIAGLELTMLVGANQGCVVESFEDGESEVDEHVVSHVDQSANFCFCFILIIVLLFFFCTLLCNKVVVFH